MTKQQYINGLGILRQWRGTRLAYAMAYLMFLCGKGEIPYATEPKWMELPYEVMRDIRQELDNVTTRGALDDNNAG